MRKKKNTTIPNMAGDRETGTHLHCHRWECPGNTLGICDDPCPERIINADNVRAVMPFSEERIIGAEPIGEMKTGAGRISGARTFSVRLV